MASALFSPLTLRNLRLENRIVVSSMCQYSADDGSATAWHRSHWGMLATSGAGLLMTEMTQVSAEGRITWADLGLYSDANERALGGMLDAVHQFSDIPVGLQLGHAGRKASSEKPWLGGQLLPPDDPHGWRPVAPSAVPVSAAEVAPIALDRAGMDKVRHDFVASAKRARHLPIAALQLHFAYGYLSHQFLSPITNRRDDPYGGSLQNRMRYPLEVFDAVRQVWPDQPHGVNGVFRNWRDGSR